MTDPPSFDDTTGGPPVLRPSRAAIRRRRRARRRRRRAGIVMVVVGLAVAAAGVALFLDDRNPDPITPSVQSSVTIRSTSTLPVATTASTVPGVTTPEPTVP